MKPMFDPYLVTLLKKARLMAIATLKGSSDFPSVRGRVSFYALPDASFVLTQVSGLPHPAMISEDEPQDCANPFLGIHIHEGGNCTPLGSENGKGAFEDAGAHLNPRNCPHPAHLGDLPPLLVDGGNALSAVVTSRFRVSDLLGHTVIIHRMADDLRTQPSGASGERIACGLIRRV